MVDFPQTIAASPGKGSGRDPKRPEAPADVVRVWERRYRAVVPHRTDANRRLYTAADIDRLRLLRRGVEAGHSISQIAGFSDAELREIADAADGNGPGAEEAPRRSTSPEEYRRLALAATLELNAVSLEDVLARTEVDLGRHALVEKVIRPLLVELGELWRRGEVRPFQEHLTSAVIGSALGDTISGRGVASAAPVIVLATPSGQHHELGCLLAATAVAMQGWRPVYLGSRLPAEEIARAAEQAGARAVGLSLVHPMADPQTMAELRKLRQLLPFAITLILGGRAAGSYRDFSDPDVKFVEDLEKFQSLLERLATQETAAGGTPPTHA